MSRWTKAFAMMGIAFAPAFIIYPYDLSMYGAHITEGTIMAMWFFWSWYEALTPEKEWRK